MGSEGEMAMPVGEHILTILLDNKSTQTDFALSHTAPATQKVKRGRQFTQTEHTTQVSVGKLKTDHSSILRDIRKTKSVLASVKAMVRSTQPQITSDVIQAALAYDSRVNLLNAQFDKSVEEFAQSYAASHHDDSAMLVWKQAVETHMRKLELKIEELTRKREQLRLSVEKKKKLVNEAALYQGKHELEYQIHDQRKSRFPEEHKAEQEEIESMKEQLQQTVRKIKDIGERLAVVDADIAELMGANKDINKKIAHTMQEAENIDAKCQSVVSEEKDEKVKLRGDFEEEIVSLGLKIKSGHKRLQSVEEKIVGEETDFREVHLRHSSSLSNLLSHNKKLEKFLKKMELVSQEEIPFVKWPENILNSLELLDLNIDEGTLHNLRDKSDSEAEEDTAVGQYGDSDKEDKPKEGKLGDVGHAETKKKKFQQVVRLVMTARPPHAKKWRQRFYDVVCQLMDDPNFEDKLPKPHPVTEREKLPMLDFGPSIFVPVSELPTQTLDALLSSRFSSKNIIKKYQKNPFDDVARVPMGHNADPSSALHSHADAWGGATFRMAKMKYPQPVRSPTPPDEKKEPPKQPWKGSGRVVSSSNIKTKTSASEKTTKLRKGTTKDLAKQAAMRREKEERERQAMRSAAWAIQNREEHGRSTPLSPADREENIGSELNEFIHELEAKMRSVEKG